MAKSTGLKTWRLEETSASPKGEREEEETIFFIHFLRGYCAIIPNTTTKTRTNCLHISGTFYLDDIPQSEYPFSKMKMKKKERPPQNDIQITRSVFFISGAKKSKEKKGKMIFWYFASQNRLLTCRVSRQSSKRLMISFPNNTLEFKKKKGKIPFLVLGT